MSLPVSYSTIPESFYHPLLVHMLMTVLETSQRILGQAETVTSSLFIELMSSVA